MLLDELADGVLGAVRMDARLQADPDMRMAVGRIDHILRYGQRLVLTPGALRLVNELAVGCRDAASQLIHVRAPSQATWFEWHGEVPWTAGGARRALYLMTIDAGAPLMGEALWMHPSHEGYLSRNWTLLDGVMTSERATGPNRPRLEHVDSRLQLAWLASLLAVVTTPRLTEREPADLSRLNKARSKRGKRPIAQYAEVVLRRDGPEDLGRAAGRSGNVAAAEGEPARRARHHVRTHWRLKRGRVEIVRPHWRGDASLGSVRRVYRVARPTERVERLRGLSASWRNKFVSTPCVMRTTVLT